MPRFPSRTFESDMRAVTVNQALNKANIGKNFMATVLTTKSFHTYVALSGEFGDDDLIKLESQLSFVSLLPADLVVSGKCIKHLDEKLKKQRSAVPSEESEYLRKIKAVAKFKKCFPRGGGLYVVVRALSELNNQMVDPEFKQGVKPRAQQDQQPQVNPLIFGGRRNCSEPKVIQAAGLAGEHLTGMTTIWFGNQRNPYPHPDPHPHLNVARPCEFCSLNEVRIMMWAFR